jgi:hypothetical protein
MNRHENLFRGSVRDHIVDDDLIGARAHEGRQLPVDTPNQVTPLEGPGVAQGNVRLRGESAGEELKRVNRSAFGIADEATKLVESAGILAFGPDNVLSSLV